MKKNKPFRELFYRSLKKTLLIMRIATFLLILGILQAYAVDTYSQKTRLSLDFSDTELIKVLDNIEEESEFFFLYNEKLLDTDRKVTIAANDQLITNILDNLFAGTDVKYSIIDRKIILAPEYLTSGTDETIYLQQQIITGRVTDSQTRESMPGVNIVVKGTSIGTISDINGNYSLTVIDRNAILVFSFIGYITQEIPLNSRTVIEVALENEVLGLEEVVVIGYGTKSKQTLTGAVSVIEPATLENRPSVESSDLLQGITSGIQISRTNTGDLRSSMNSITIRGVTSRSNPGVLVVVDGVTQPYSDSRALDNINPNDIESISILKDGQAAIYGARAAGGVILVTTKQGRTDRPVITASVIATINKPSLMRETLDVLKWFEMNNEAFVNDGNLTNIMTPVINYIETNNITFQEVAENNGKHIFDKDPFGVPFSLGHYNWNDIMFDPSLQQNYNISVSGRKDKLNYYESINYIDQDGMLAYGKNYKKRLLITLKNDYDITDFLKIRSNFNIGNQKVVEPYGYSRNTYNGGVQGALFFVTPMNMPFTKGGHYHCIGGFGDPIGFAEAAGNTTDKLFIINGKLGAEITPFKNLVVTGEIASNYNITDIDYASVGFAHYDIYDKFAQMSTDDANTGPPTAGSDLRNNRYTIGNIFAKYSLTGLKNHKINLMTGYSHEENDYRSFSAYRRYGLISSQLPTMIGGSSDEQYNSESKSDYALNSIFSRLEYDYRNRYLFEAVFRYDGSSKFAKGYKWAPFYGLSGAWILTEENFMKNLTNVFDFLKVRASWGQLGNQSGIDLYDYLSQITVSGSYPMGSWLSPYQIQNATLGKMASRTRTWETIESTNFGLDFNAFNSKFVGSVDVFVKNNKDMFYTQEFPSVLGTTPPSINGAHVRTKGWEVEVGWEDKISQLNYSIHINLSDNKTKVIDLADNVTPKLGSNSFVQNYPVNSYFGYKFDGIIENETEMTAYTSKFTSGIPNNLKLGDPRYMDLDGDKKLEALVYQEDDKGIPTSTSGDLVYIGDGSQHYLYGINLGLRWKNLDFSSFLQGVLNWDVLLGIRPCNNWYEPDEAYFYHQTWAPDRTSAFWPRLSMSGTIKGYNYQFSDAPYKLFNNRYLRFKNVQLGYNIPKNLIGKFNIEMMRVYFSGTDIWELTNLPGKQDPETPFTIRVSPFPRQYSFGIDLTF